MRPILRLAHYNLETVRSELLHIEDVARVRRARTLYDLALAAKIANRHVSVTILRT